LHCGIHALVRGAWTLICGGRPNGIHAARHHNDQHNGRLAMKLFCSTFRRSILKACALLGFIAAAPLAGAIPAHAQTPNQLLYLFSGLTDNQDFATGASIASVIHCSNFSGQTAAVQFVVDYTLGLQAANKTILISNLETITAATKDTLMYLEDLYLNTGALTQGFALVVASSPYIVCTAQVVDAKALVPVGIALHGLRFNPIPGSQE